MAEPLDPNTPAAPGTPGSPGGGNGDNARIDRDMTPLASNQKINYAALTAIGGVALLFVMWWAGAFSTEQSETQEKTQPLQTQAAPPLPPPTQPPLPKPEPYTPPEPPPPFDEMAAERERMLMLKVRGLQKQMFERRRSKMLVVSDPAAQQPAVQSAALSADGAAPSPQSIPSPFGIDPYEENPNAPRMGDVGPVLQQEAVPARLLRTTGYTITEGTVIPAIMETAINSQLPGLVRALNSADVYSHDGSQLLIPKGSRLVGRYQSSVRRGQVRVFIIWTRILRADGLSVLINSPGTDPLGRAGLEGDVDTHFFQIFGAAILLSILDAGLDIGTEAVQDQGSNNTNIGQGSFTGSGLSRAGEIALQDSIRIQPTIHIDQGTRISIMVARDLDFEAVEMARAAGQRK